MTEERKEQLYKAWDELSRRQLSNSENLGRAILSLSIAGLGFSLAFIKDVVSPDTVANVYLLHGSWWTFAAAIATTLLAYHTSQSGLKKQFAQIRNELSGEKDSKLESKERQLFLITEWLGYASHGFYLFAVVLTIIFIQTNAGGIIMPNKKTQAKPLREQDQRVKVPPRDRIDEQAAPRVEILPEPSPNTDTGTDAPKPNTDIVPATPQPNSDPGSSPKADSPPSGQEPSQSSDK